MEKNLRLPHLRLTLANLIPVILSALFIVFPVGQLTRFSLLRPEIHLQLLDVFVGLSLPLAVYLILNHRISLSRLPFIRPFIYFIVIAHLSLIFNIFNLGTTEIGIAYLYLLRLLAYSSLFVCGYWVVQQEPKLKQFITNGLVFSVLLTSVFGIFQYLFFPDIRPLEIYDWDPHLYRLVGTFLDPGFIGLIFVLGLNLLLWNNWTKLSRFSRKYLALYSGVTLLYVSLALTYSRASYLAFLVSVALISYIKKSGKFFFLVLTLFALTIIILPRPEGIGVRLERGDSIKARIQNWGNSLRIFTDHPIFGVGFNAYRYSQASYGFLDPDKTLLTHAGAGADSSILFTLATTGLAGAAFFIWFLISLIRFLARRGIYLLVSSWLIVLVHSFFLNSLYYPWVMLWLLLLTASNLAVRTKD